MAGALDDLHELVGCAGDSFGPGETVGRAQNRPVRVESAANRDKLAAAIDHTGEGFVEPGILPRPIRPVGRRENGRRVQSARRVPNRSAHGDVQPVPIDHLEQRRVAIRDRLEGPVVAIRRNGKVANVSEPV